MINVEQIRKFWHRVDRRAEGECWPWMGAKRRDGYGLFYVTGRMRRAHRISWALTNGAPFPSDRDGCHRCNNPSCVNPAHIYPGTRADNVRDAMVRGTAFIPTSTSQPATHCHKGHALAGENLGVTPRGHRRCRACTRDRDALRWEKIKSDPIALERAREQARLRAQRWAPKRAAKKLAKRQALADQREQECARALLGVRSGRRIAA